MTLAELKDQAIESEREQFGELKFLDEMAVIALIERVEKVVKKMRVAAEGPDWGWVLEDFADELEGLE